VAHWLLKEEPTHYSFDDLMREGRTAWSGVHNPLARQHLRASRRGDSAFYYHTGKERAIVGVVRVDSAPRPDPQDTRGGWSVDVRPVRSLRRPIPLAELREDARLRDLELLRIPRLSVVRISPEQWTQILRHEATPPMAAARRRA
jgi:predicted RNA-binding protein with PUA-like domain